MLAVQKPPMSLFAATSFRPSHSRHPSAPVVVRPTHTPGLLTLSKPQPTRSHQQQQQQQQRSLRSSPREKISNRPNQPAHPQESKKTPSTPPKADASAPEKAKTVTAAIVASADKPRGRQQAKPAKDKAGQRSPSLSTARAHARRPPHQPSPPPPTRIPSQAEAASQQPVTPCESPNPFDPFVSTEAPRQPSGSPKVNAKLPFASPPQLATQPSGKLARRRQNKPPSSPTPPKAIPAPRRKDRATVRLSKDDSAIRPSLVSSSSTPVRRPSFQRTGMPLAEWDFPICDDSADQADLSDVTPPATPVREAASAPSKKSDRTSTWQQALAFDDAPRTAPLSHTYMFPFTAPRASQTPTPAQRRRHQRVPSDGMFNMSMDEDSSNSDVFDSYPRVPIALPKRRAQVDAQGSPSQAKAMAHVMASSAPEGYYAGSMFQNSPSPDELPAPTFRA